MVECGKHSRLSGFGRGLRLLREAAGVTQGELAARTDHAVRKSQISAYENERARPSLESLAAVLQALDADFAELQRAIELARKDRRASPSPLSAAFELRKDLQAGVDADKEDLPAFLVLDLRPVQSKRDPERVARSVKDYVDLARAVLRRVEQNKGDKGRETSETEPADRESNGG